MMRRLFGMILLLLGFIGCVVTIVCVVATWRVQQRLVDLNNKTYQRLDARFEIIEQRLDRVHTNLDRVQKDLITIRLNSQSSEPTPFVPAARYLILLALTEKLEPKLNEVRVAISTIQEAIVLVNDMSDLIESLSSTTVDRLDLTNIQEATDRVQIVMSDSKELARLLDQLVTQHAGSREIEIRSSRLEGFTIQAIEQIDKASLKVQAGRTQLAQIHNDVHFWLTVAAIVLTLLLVWVGAGQYLLMIRGWRLVVGVRSGQSQS